jgi:hypothetical protein
MNSFPVELISNVSNFLEKTDDINFKIAMKRFELHSTERNHYYIIIDGYGSVFTSRDVNSWSFKDGFCYATLLRKPFQSILKHGRYLKTDDMMECFKEFLLKYDPRYTQSDLEDSGHMTWRTVDDDGKKTKKIWMVHLDTGFETTITRQSYKHWNESWKLLSCPNKFGAWRTPAIPRNVITTGNFSLMDLLNAQPTVNGYYCPEHQVYQSRGKGAPDVSATLNGTTLELRFENRMEMMEIDSQDIGKIAHEYVANKLRDSTDMPLSTLGITGEESVLTPDCIDITNKKVLELGTNRSDNINSLINDFEGKKIKYDYLLSPIGCNTYYLIVGNTAIVSNMNLRQSTVDDLCARAKAGWHLSNLISEVVGYDISQSDRSEDARIARAIFSSINLNKEDIDSFDFPFDEIMSHVNEPSDEDFEHSKHITARCMNESRPRNPTERKDLMNYLSKFKESECQNHQKRITNVPLVLSVKNTEDNEIDAYNSDMPGYMKSIWGSAHNLKVETKSIEEMLIEANRLIEPEVKHISKKQSLFRPHLSEHEKLLLAETGVGAKFFSGRNEIIDLEAKSKKSFSPKTDTRDIQMFLNSETMDKGFLRTNSSIIKAVVKSKQESTGYSEQQSVEIWKQLIDYKLLSYYDQVTEIFQELSLNYKHYTINDYFMLKQTVSGIKMIIRNTGSHMFVAFAFPKQNSKILDTGRLGPKLYVSNNYIFTDFASYNEPTIEHFAKAGPYMCSLLIHLLSNFKQDPTTMSDEVKVTFNLISLLYLNNKTDSEELMTSQRYLFMKLFEDATQDPYIFIDRLPEVLRSRLSVFLLNKTIGLMDYYSANRVLKIPNVSGSVVMYDYLNIKSLITGNDITLSQKINEFYYGYVVSKERGRGSDRNFKIVKKILQEEYKFRDAAISVFTKMDKSFVTYSTDPSLLRVFCHIFRNILSDKVGSDFKKILLEDFLNSLSYTSFSQLATLKASAKDHSALLTVPDNVDDDRKKLLRSLNERNKTESSKRPKVLEALIKLTKEFTEETKKPVKHVIQLIPWCLKKLEAKGCFDSDIFPKPQHGGDREIHVLEIMARIVQYTVELISRVYSKHLISETITHPETKESFVKKHYKQTAETFDKSFVLSKSADASKWCQRHHVSHFAAMMVGVTHPILHGFILRTLKLWTRKKISFPLQLVATLLANKKTYSTNSTFIRFRDNFYKGEEVITQPMGNKMEIMSGMMQGILHYTSTLYHTMIQEVCKIMVVSIGLKKFGLNLICNIVQGSDDSGMMLGVSGTINKTKIRDCYTLLRFKEEISNYLSVYWNVCKSSIGTVDLIEYNSEWHVRHQIIKPTFRWISACMELSITERFIDRYRIMNQLLTQCLEGGATTLECAVIQMNQCWMHYILLGLNHSPLADITTDALIELQDPSLGFFPMDFDISCGIPGVDFSLYNLAVNGKYRIPAVSDENMLQYDFEGDLKKLVPKDLRSVKLKFGKLYIWKSLVERLDLGTLEDAIQKIEDDPMVLFGRHTSWEEEKPNLILKVFSPGVKESINNVSSLLRLVASSAFILNRPCITVYHGDTYTKSSLYFAINDRLKTRPSYNSMSTIRRAFPLHAEYKTFLESIQNVTKSSQAFLTKFHRTSKEKIIVFEVVKNQHTLMELCKRAWHLGGKVSLSSRQFDAFWSQTKLQYPFLKDNIKETAAELKMTIVELKNFIESLEMKTRSVTLYDSPVKYGGVISAISRIYWPDTKLRSQYESSDQELLKLRSHIFSVSTCWYSQARTVQMVTQLIKNSKALRRQLQDIPVKYRKLKTLFDWINGDDKIKIIEQLRSHKQGVIGYFAQRQSGYGQHRKGNGLWQGQVIGIPCKIQMFDTGVERITLKRLSDVNQLGNVLCQLMKEFKCDFGKAKYSSNIWLSTSGKIVTKRHDAGSYIPIWLDPNLSVNIISDMETNPWSINVTNTTVRLTMSEGVGSQNIKYTILSDSFSQKDWNPELSGFVIDSTISSWHNGTAISISELEKTISSMIPENQSQFNRFVQDLERKNTNQGWNMSRFRDRLISNLVAPEEHKHIVRERFSEEHVGNLTMLEIEKMMMDISMGYDDSFFGRTNLSWEEEETESFNILDGSYQMTSEMENYLSNLADDLDVTYQNPDKEDVDDLKWMKMAQSNRFFENLNKLSEIQTGSSIHQLYDQMKVDKTITAQGLLGKIMSLILLRHVVEGYDTQEHLADLASESSRQVNTIMSEKELIEMDQGNLEATINQLSGIVGTLSGSAKDEMNKIIEKYKRLLLLKMSPTRTSDLEDINYSEFISKVIQFLFSNNISKYSKHNVDDNLKLSLIKVELLEHAEKQLQSSDISNHEYTLIREYINRNTVSSYLIDLLNSCYDLTIDFSMYKNTLSIDDIDIVLN